MGKYVTRKPIQIEARYFDADVVPDLEALHEFVQWCGATEAFDFSTLVLKTAQGQSVNVSWGEYIILENQERHPGCAYPCDKTEFEEKYMQIVNPGENTI